MYVFRLLSRLSLLCFHCIIDCCLVDDPEHTVIFDADGERIDML